MGSGLTVAVDPARGTQPHFLLEDFSHFLRNQSLKVIKKASLKHRINWNSFEDRIGTGTYLLYFENEN